jgi:hypothetical protein
VHRAPPPDGVILAKGITVKKVRYAAGALGALGTLPAAALLAPAATAATTHPAPAIHGKSVRMHSRVANGAPCDARHTHSSSGDVRGYISYSQDNGCIGFVLGHFYHHSSAGLQMRVRNYEGGIQQSPTVYRNGVINSTNHSIQFSWAPDVSSISKTCQAIVVKSTHRQVTGTNAVCEATGF